MQAYQILGPDAFGLNPERAVPRDSFNADQVINRLLELRRNPDARCSSDDVDKLDVICREMANPAGMYEYGVMAKLRRSGQWVTLIQVSQVSLTAYARNSFSTTSARTPHDYVYLGDLEHFIALHTPDLLLSSALLNGRVDKQEATDDKSMQDRVNAENYKAFRCAVDRMTEYACQSLDLPVSPALSVDQYATINVGRLTAEAPKLYVRHGGVIWRVIGAVYGEHMRQHHYVFAARCVRSGDAGQDIISVLSLSPAEIDDWSDDPRKWSTPWIELDGRLI